MTIGGGQSAHERREQINITRWPSLWDRTIRDFSVLAVGGLLELRLEEFVGDPHLDVVGLAGKDPQADVLGFPAKTSKPILKLFILQNILLLLTKDAKALLGICVSTTILQNCTI